MRPVVLASFGIFLTASAAAQPPTRLSVQIATTPSDRVKPPQLVATPAVPALAPGDARTILVGRETPMTPDAFTRLEATGLTSMAGAQLQQYLFEYATEAAKLARYWRVQAKEAQAASDGTNEMTRKAAANREVATAANRAKTYLLKSVRAFKGLTEDPSYSQFGKRDLGMFAYGYVLQSEQYIREARSVYDKLLVAYPESPYVVPVHALFGDYYFDANQLADAEARYKKVIEYRRSPLHWYATYKLAWVKLRSQRYPEALELFYQVVLGTKADPNQALGHAAKLDFVRAYAEVGRASQAASAFQRVDPGMVPELLRRLAQVYLEDGKQDRAIDVYRLLLASAPADRAVCAWQYNIARATLVLPGASDIDKVHEIENLVKLRTTLAAKHALPPAEADDCLANAAAMAGELGRAFHAQAQKTHSTDAMAYAAALYRAHLGGLPEAADHAQILYLDAELAWMRAEAEPDARARADFWQHAADAFTEIAKSSDRARAADAAQAAAAALQEVARARAKP